jgi:hypothetical protein
MADENAVPAGTTPKAVSEVDTKVDSLPPLAAKVAYSNSKKSPKRNALGQLLRPDGKVDMRSLRPKDSINTSGLMKGGWPEIRSRREEKDAKKAEIAGRLTTREGVLALLREMMVDDELPAGPRATIASILLEPQAGEKANRCWKCKGELADVPASVQAWIDGVDQNG